MRQTKLQASRQIPYSVTALPGSADHQALHRANAYLDPDLNKYDLEHVTTQHSIMSTPEWEKLYRDTWKEFYTPEHMETVLRRAYATGVSISNMMVLLVWFHFCIIYEKIDPLQGGYLRRKYRRDRRPTLPRESVFHFYPQYAVDLFTKHVHMARLAWRFHRFCKRLKTEPDTRNYNDIALTADEDTDLNALEMNLTQILVTSAG